MMDLRKPNQLLIKELKNFTRQSCAWPRILQNFNITHSAEKTQKTQAMIPYTGQHQDIKSYHSARTCTKHGTPRRTHLLVEWILPMSTTTHASLATYVYLEAYCR